MNTEKIIQNIFTNAIKKQASDIHFEMLEHTALIRLRIDGLLHRLKEFTHTIMHSIINAIKVMSHLDIAIKRLPQDGRLQIESKDARVSTYPTLYGEKMVIRLLASNTELKSIDELGLSNQHKQLILSTLKRPQGMIVVTGPTGSGKTVTLYTLLQILNQTDRNITTIEDPIEIQLSGINQSQINPKIGFDFSAALKALLRQDPDIMMIGEIRDQETAQIAVRAALTGHLVLTTLHTNNLIDTIIRLMNLDIPAYLLEQALTLLIAQRLVRKTCVHCKGNTCALCQDGYHGRIGVFDVLLMDDSVRHHITTHQLNQLSLTSTLWKSALQHVHHKITTAQEIMRVIPHD